MADRCDEEERDREDNAVAVLGVSDVTVQEQSAQLQNSPDGEDNQLATGSSVNVVDNKGPTQLGENSTSAVYNNCTILQGQHVHHHHHHHGNGSTQHIQNTPPYPLHDNSSLNHGPCQCELCIRYHGNNHPPLAEHHSPPPRPDLRQLELPAPVPQLPAPTSQHTEQMETSENVALGSNRQNSYGYPDPKYISRERNLMPSFGFNIRQTGINKGGLTLSNNPLQTSPHISIEVPSIRPQHGVITPSRFNDRHSISSSGDFSNNDDKHAFLEPHPKQHDWNQPGLHTSGTGSRAGSDMYHYQPSGSATSQYQCNGNNLSPCQVDMLPSLSTFANPHNSANIHGRGGQKRTLSKPPSFSDGFDLTQIIRSSPTSLRILNGSRGSSTSGARQLGMIQEGFGHMHDRYSPYSGSSRNRHNVSTPQGYVFNGMKQECTNVYSICSPQSSNVPDLMNNQLVAPQDQIQYIEQCVPFNMQMNQNMQTNIHPSQHQHQVMFNSQPTQQSQNYIGMGTSINNGMNSTMNNGMNSTLKNGMNIHMSNGMNSAMTNGMTNTMIDTPQNTSHHSPYSNVRHQYSYRKISREVNLPLTFVNQMKKSNYGVI